jgi:hypothetical protein
LPGVCLTVNCSISKVVILTGVTIVQLPYFPECQHPRIRAIAHCSDPQLLQLFQENPASGIYFTAIFCRYNSLVYALVQHVAPSSVQVDYVFALTWRTIFHELQTLQLQPNSPTTLQSWLLEVTAACINQLEIPPVDAIRYRLQTTSPPFWCYVEAAVEALPPRERLLVLMANCCQWSSTLMASYLQAEGERITVSEVEQHLQEGYRQLELIIPSDIRALYLQPTRETSPISQVSSAN